MKVKILGTGCPKCKKLFAEAEAALAASGVQAELVKIEKLNEIMGYGVMMTPALVVDEQVKVAGRIPSKEDMVKWFVEAASQNA